jgi:hypothetical protein
MKVVSVHSNGGLGGGDFEASPIKCPNHVPQCGGAACCALSAGQGKPCPYGDVSREYLNEY